MNSLDELFGAALDRESLQATAERRAAVADAAVRGARRQRRVRGTFQAVAIVAVIGAGAVVGSQYLGNDAVTPADPTPSATPSVSEPPAIISPAGLDYESVLDERFPAAEPMDAADWANVTTEWDSEIVSFVGRGRDVLGSVVAIYLTPPGGERMLAWATNDTSLVAPQLFYFDPASKTAMVTDWQVINLVDGSVTGVELAEGGDLMSIPMSPAMGRASTGDSLFFFYTVDSDDVHTAHVYRMSGGVGAGVSSGVYAPSSVWGDVFVASAEDGVRILSVDGSVVRDWPDLAGCFFQTWNLDGSFNVTCGATRSVDGATVRVDPNTGATAEIADAPTTTAIDTHRSWGDAWNTNLPAVPPVIYEDGVEVADLGAGFGEEPKGYGAIFGVRSE